MEPKRILHMIGSLEVGGSQMMVINLYKTIDRSKMQFDFVVDHPDRMELAPVVRALGARIYFMPTFVGSNLQQVRKAWNRFFEEHPEYKILHSHVRSYASVYLPIARKHGLKTIIHSHSTSNGSGLKSVVKKILQYPLRFQADYFFSCSAEAGQWLFGRKIAEGQRHFIVNNAIDAKKYRYTQAVRDAMRQQLGLAGKTVYAHVGRFHPAKNHSFLLDVFAGIHAQQKNAVLLLIGDGECRGEIEDKIRLQKLGESVKLLGARQNVAELLQAADLFLFPSLWEGLGIVAVEAQAAGLPCICSDQVPQLVNVTDRCTFLPLQADRWVEAALQEHREPADTYRNIVDAGFDIHATVSWLQNFYEKLAGGER